MFGNRRTNEKDTIAVNIAGNPILLQLLPLLNHPTDADDEELANVDAVISEGEGYQRPYRC